MTGFHNHRADEPPTFLTHEGRSLWLARQAREQAQAALQSAGAVTYEIRFDETAGVYEVYAVSEDGAWVWLAACDTQAAARAAAAAHKLEG